MQGLKGANLLLDYSKADSQVDFSFIMEASWPLSKVGDIQLGFQE